MTHKSLISLLFFSSTFFSHLAFGKVWEDNQPWTPQLETTYQNWMNSPEVYADMFTDPSSDYYKVHLDCADVAYALRIIFSYKNSLPFVLKNPTGSRVHPIWTNDMARWDSLKELDRVRAFIRYVGASVGTENLTHNDSYPVAIKSISPSDFFMFKKSSNGKFIRHTYLIKRITETGNYDLLYSTQSRKQNKEPLGYKKDYELYNKPDKYSPNWGFRRYKAPEYYSVTDIKEAPGYSLEQYTLAKENSETSFFRYVKSQLQSIQEEPEQLVRRQINNLCQQAIDRIQVVQNGIDYRRSTQNKCMNYEDYDIHSTPSRDGRIVGSYEILKNDILYLKETKEWETKVKPETRELAEAIYMDDTPLSLHQKLYMDCPINFIAQSSEPVKVPEEVAKALSISNIFRVDPTSISLRELYLSFEKKDVSFHPNDNIFRRWGFLVDKKTKCKVHYE